MTDTASILIVDDRPEKCLALEAVLDDLGQNIVRAYSGREALRQVLHHEFAVILLDVNMPDMDGFETASLIRQRKSSRHTPIIFVTSFGDDMHASRGYALGAVDYILAPVLPDVLRTKVAVLVDLFRKNQQLKRQAESLQRRAAQAQKLAAASVTIASALSVEKMLQTVTDAARDVVGTHQAITLLFGEATGNPGARPVTVASFSEKYADWRSRTPQLDAVTKSIVAQSRTATRMTEAELRDHPDWAIVSELDIPPVTGGVLAAPLLGRDATNLGVLYLSDRYDGEFTRDDEAVLVQLAQMTSIGIENMLFAQEREANRVKDEFLATLSHELRTPLSAILGWTQLLKMGKGKADLDHGLSVIERNVKAQTKLVEDLLDVSRITTGKLRLAMKATSLGAIVSAAVDSVRPVAETRQVTVSCEIDADRDTVLGDADRLQQVIWNLLTNAVKFTPQHGSVRVVLRREDQRLTVAVTDTGQGISPSFLPYVFDRFRQADSSSTRSHGGLGIGLTIVRHIVELHGGSAKAHSDGEGAGSTFTINLPIHVPAITAQPETPTREPKLRLTEDALPIEEGRLAGLRVLLVEDDDDARELLSEVLRRGEAEVTTASCVDEAIEAFLRFDPDLIVSDIAMPDRDGYDLIRVIREMPVNQGGQTPAIAVTAYARDDDRQRALAAGFQAHLAKPVEPAQLINLVAELATSKDGEPTATRRSG